MLKKNIAKVMAATTVLTAAAPMATAFADVIESNQEQEIKEFKQKVYDIFNTKYASNQALLAKTDRKGEDNFVYENIQIGDEKCTSYADFVSKFDKAFAKLQNGQKLVVTYNSKEAIRILEDGTVVDSDVTKYEKDEITFDAERNTGAGIDESLEGVVYGELADGTAYAKLPITNGYITVKNGDVKLDVERPIFKVVDGYYVDEAGNSIKMFVPGTVVNDIEDVKASGGVIEGYYASTETELEDDAIVSGTIAIVKNANSATKEDVKTSDLYEASNTRLTKKGNELRKAIINADIDADAAEDSIEAKEDKLQVKIFGTNKAGETVSREELEAVENLDDVAELNLVNIKVIFEERANEISEWNPVYEMTIEEERGNGFFNAIEYVIKNEDANIDLAAGLDRYETAIELSKKGWEEGEISEYAVLVSGADDKLVDGLTATPLAAALDAPVLLTQKDSIPQEVIDEIERLEVETVYIVGGTSAVSEEVQTLLTKTYKKKVVRLAGDDRYETSVAVANKVIANGGNTEEAFVVGGKGQADALSISAVAGMKKAPILLTNADSLNKDVLHFLDKNLEDQDNKTDVFVVGGTSSVSNTVQNKLANLYEVERLSGEGRQETNAAVISRFEKENALDEEVETIVVAKSHDKGLVDALAAGAYAARTNAHIVLATNELTESQEDALAKVDSDIDVTKVQAGYGIAEKIAKFIKGL